MLKTCEDASRKYLFSQQHDQNDEPLDPATRAIALEILRGGTKKSIAAAKQTHQNDGYLTLTTPHNSISFCTCLKCGSTSLTQAIYQMLEGGGPTKLVEIGEDGQPPFIQDYMGWGSELVSRGGGISSNKNNNNNNNNNNNINNVHFQIYRDPIKRLISSWKSRVRCCHNKTQFDPCFGTNNNNDVPKTTTRVQKHPNGSVTTVTETVSEERKTMPKLFFAEGLIRLGGTNSNATHSTSVKYCMSFGEYVRELHNIHEQNLEGYLNQHFLPQHLACPTYDETIYATVEEAEKVVREYGLVGDFEHYSKHFVVEHYQVSKQDAGFETQEGFSEVMKLLCEITRAEFKGLGVENKNEYCL